jgi:L-alanine-DL-glutamate epimerase-like enolase superfamily enzyme
MRLTWRTFTLQKRVPLTISRGTTSANTNIRVKIAAEEIEGWGEASPFSVITEEKDPAKLISELEAIAPILAPFHPLQREEIEEILHEKSISSATRAAIDTALYDWLGKKAGLPLWKILGLNREKIPPVSVTIGIGSPESAAKRTSDWLEMSDFKLLKVKLGSPDGVEADKASILAIRSVAPDLPITVDANGGWNLDNSLEMCYWLAERNVLYVEQPLPVGREEELEKLSERSPLPIFVDESCFSSSDIPRLAPVVRGINIKLMKAGGLGEVLKMIHIARACGLQVMFGCYSDSSLANTALAHLAPLIDYLDLDSHLNLRNDPFVGAGLQGGCLVLNDAPGLGVQLRE